MDANIRTSKQVELRELNADEVALVSGGSFIGTAFSNAIKGIGEGLASMARKG